jgi:hypothetical protein
MLLEYYVPVKAKWSPRDLLRGRARPLVRRARTDPSDSLAGRCVATELTARLSEAAQS